MRDRGISEEWDRIAEERHQQIISGKDVSFDKVLVPTLLSMTGVVTGLRVLDVGCGSGVLCHRLAFLGATTVGVDSSTQMVAIAEREFGKNRRIEFCKKSIVDFARSYHGKKFDICVSNMALVTMGNLGKVMSAVASLLKANGTFVFTVTHPCFWNQYRKYEPARAFNYVREHAQTGKFTISLDRSIRHGTTHFHRPLSNYFNALKNASFQVIELVEPVPNKRDLRLYPRPWHFPRFLSIKALYVPGSSKRFS